MGPWEVAGTVAAIIFGAIGAAVAIAKISWDRRDRRAAAERERAEAEVRSHELERLRREQEEWRRRDAAAREESEFKVYSEAEARAFLHQYPAMSAPPSAPARSRGLGALVAVAALVAVVVVVLLVVWIANR